MKYKKIDLIDLASKIILVIVALIVIYFLILKIIGRSPTMDQIQNMLIVAAIAALFNINYRLGSIETRLDNFAGQFQALANDFKAHIKTAKK